SAESRGLTRKRCNLSITVVCESVSGQLSSGRSLVFSPLLSEPLNLLRTSGCIDAWIILTFSDRDQGSNGLDATDCAYIHGGHHQIIPLNPKAVPEAMLKKTDIATA